MIKYTQQFLKKLEDFLKENLYEVRYEKGNFKSGYCILEAKKVVVVNRFATIESRIQSLFEISQTLIAQDRIISDVQQLFIKQKKEKTQPEIPSYIAEIAEEVTVEPAEPAN